METPSRSGVIGVGYVGLVTAACFADLGHEVVCLDVKPERIDALRAGTVPIYEPGVDRLLQRNRSRLRFTLDLREVMAALPDRVRVRRHARHALRAMPTSPACGRSSTSCRRPARSSCW